MTASTSSAGAAQPDTQRSSAASKIAQARARTSGEGQKVAAVFAPAAVMLPERAISSGAAAVAAARRNFGTQPPSVVPPTDARSAPRRAVQAQPSRPTGPAKPAAPVVRQMFVRNDQTGDDGSMPRSAPPTANADHADLMTVRGTIERVMFRDEVKGVAALQLRDSSGKRVTLRGTLAFAPAVGQLVSARAEEVNHPKFGRQFQAELITEEVAIDRAGAVAHMVRVLDGVSEPIAQKLYDAFGESVFIVLQDEPHRFLGIGSINEYRLSKIVQSWAKDSAIRNIGAALQPYGLGAAVPARIYQAHGDESLTAIKRKPYVLAELDGVGFKAADRIAADNGIPTDSEARIACAVEYALKSAGQNGHTARPMNMLVSDVQRLTELTGGDKALRVGAVIDDMVDEGGLVSRHLGGERCISHRSVAEAEAAIARRIQELFAAGGADEALAEAAHVLAAGLNDADQSAAVVNVFKSPVSVITGRPGCGKTTVQRVITEVALKAGLTVVMCAPTGKAAVRMTAATGQGAGTLHSLLKPEQGMGEFAFNRDNPLDGDLFIVDETGMNDTAITASFLDAVPDGARVLLVGDVDQLESVGAGKVLHDAIHSGVIPVSRLQTPHRTALDSDIVVNAHKVISGDASGIDLKGEKDFRFVPAVTDDQVHQQVLKTYLEMVAKYGVDGVQVLSAQHGTNVGVKALNALLRQAVNPPSAAKPELEHRGQSFRLGDRVMRTKNNRELGVANGEVGVVAFVDLDKRRLRVNFGDRDVIHEAPQLQFLELANAISYHKSQGSEYGGVISVTPAAHRGMLTRKLIYTGMTRGKKESVILGDASVFRAAVARQTPPRCTGLADELRAAMNAEPALTTPPPKQAPLRLPVPARSPAPASLPESDQPNGTFQRTALFRRNRP